MSMPALFSFVHADRNAAKVCGTAVIPAFANIALL